MRLGLIIALAASGCMSVGIPHYTQHVPVIGNKVEVYLIGNFPNYLEDGVSKSIREWNKALNGHLDLGIIGHVASLEEAPKDAIVIIATLSSASMIQASHVENTMAVTYPYGRGLPSALIYLAVDRIPPSSEHVILHELGHAMGAEDSDNASELMSRKYYPFKEHCIDLPTIMQVSKANHWGKDTLNYCQ